MAYGKEWSMRTIWYYWLSYPLWIGATGILTSFFIEGVLEVKFSPEVVALIAFVMVWAINTIRIQKNEK
jgi:glutamate:GABA antiporter